MGHYKKDRRNYNSPRYNLGFLVFAVISIIFGITMVFASNVGTALLVTIFCLILFGIMSAIASIGVPSKNSQNSKDAFWEYFFFGGKTGPNQLTQDSLSTDDTDTTLPDTYWTCAGCGNQNSFRDERCGYCLMTHKQSNRKKVEEGNAARKLAEAEEDSTLDQALALNKDENQENMQSKVVH